VAEFKQREKGSMLRPLKALSFLGREPVTLPFAPREAAPLYRGLHLNDWQLCIGCGTCASICDNRAIRMIHFPELPADALQGIKPRRPAIDYGRCCWCALCVDICPTGSLSLSREYIHISQNLDNFFVLPDEKGIHGFGFPKGWAKSEESDFLDLDRRPMPELDPQTRIDSMAEIVQGFDGQSALLEASRCIQCGMCHDACPTHMNAPEYIRAIWSGDAEEAVRQIYRTMPFGHVCGRVCTHRCETACSIGKRGEPIAIRWLKRFAMDSVPHERIEEIAAEGRVTTATGRRVAMVGAGPACLTAAFDLARLGHQVTVFEGQSEAGGMVCYGIPEYRMPRSRLGEEIQVIQSMGVEIRCDAWVGEDPSMAQLEHDYDAVLLGTGLHLGRSTRVPGSEHPKVRRAVDLLRSLWRGEDLEVAPRLVVIGGGNVAMDIGRSLARLQKRRYGRVDVTLTCLEPREQMLADPEEIREAEEEGLRIFPARGPKHCLVEGDSLKGLETVRCLSIFDAQGRFHPLYDESDMAFYEADEVIEAIGQAASLEYLGAELTERLEWQRGRIKVDGNGRTSLPWLWAAGDLVEGPDVVHAVAAGHRAARSIHAYLVSEFEEKAA
jgi:glutamate synthase (NADPH/NADH) small chain